MTVTKNTLAIAVCGWCRTFAVRCISFTDPFPFSDCFSFVFLDAYPNIINSPKGTIVIKMQVRHDDPAMLEKLKDMTIWIERKLEKEISMSCYATREDLLVGGKRTMKKRTLRKGTCCSVFFSEPSSTKIPSSCKEGDVLMGSASYCSGEASLPGEGKRPNGFPISFTVGPKTEKVPSEEEVVEPKDERTSEERLNEAICDLKVDQLTKLTSAEKESGVFETTYSELWKQYPNHIPLLMANLKYLDDSKKRSESLEKIVDAADRVIAQISEDELALHFGKKVDKEDPKKAKQNKDLEKKKQQFLEALVRKALCFAEMMDREGAGQQFEETLGKLKEWVDIDANGKYAALAIERDSRLKRYGLVLKRINKLISKSNGKETGGVKPFSKADLLEKRCEILKTLGYSALAKRDEAMKLRAKPQDFMLF
jgi:tripeptidyl-peptidase-2